MTDITVSGVLYDKYARTARPVVLIGEAMGKLPDNPNPPDPGNGGGSSPPGQDKKKNKWEYMVYYTGTHSRHDDEFIAKMNELGADGWWLTSTDDMYVYFARELED